MKHSIGLVERSLHAKNQINPFIPFDRTPTCDNLTDRQTQTWTQGHRLAQRRADDNAFRSVLLSSQFGQPLSPLCAVAPTVLGKSAPVSMFTVSAAVVGTDRIVCGLRSRVYATVERPSVRTIATAKEQL